MKALPNLCTSFLEEACQVWSDMSEAESLGLPRNEETTTEQLLLNLARKHNGRGLEIKAFTKTDESANGADWAFWFMDSSGCGIGVRIQAKRLFAKKGCYASLYHQSNSQREKSEANDLPTPNQCEVLLTRKDGLVPIYAFYNSNKLRFCSKLAKNKNWTWLRRFGFPFPEWGISIASAIEIKKANWGQNNHPGDFSMIPWHLLVCEGYWDDQPADRSLPSLVGHGLRKLYSIGSDEGGDEIRDLGFNFEPKTKNNSPDWVRFLHRVCDAEDLRQVGEAENHLIEVMGGRNLKGVAIVEETEKDDD